MPVDYSKWDAIELSDDSDIEVHPNVDKKSFIRAKQAQIHADRARRRHQIQTLKYERIINDGLLERIDRLLTALKSHRAEASPNRSGEEEGETAKADEVVFQALIESAGDPSEDRPPEPPAEVHANVKEDVSYSKMMAGLVDQVKKDVDEGKMKGLGRLEGFINGIQSHRKKVEGLQKDLLKKLDELDKEEKKHITSDDIHTGFDYSNVSKGQPTSPKGKAKDTESSVELLNPATKPAPLDRADTGQSSGFDADIEDGPNPDAVSRSARRGSDEDKLAKTRASKPAKEFAKIPLGDYRADLQFISEHPEILTESDSDGLLIEAFHAQEAGKEKYAKQCVHQALLIQYCRQLGRDGVQLFFKRITTPGHQAQKLFIDDVNETYAKIRDRAKEVEEVKEEEGEKEQIQLHAVDPNTTIQINVPPPVPTNLDPNELSATPPPDPDHVHARQIFESFPPGLQRALESGSLDEVNRVLGKMSVSEAEEVVAKLGEGGMLSLEEGVVDATTEEGRRIVEEIERTGRMPGEKGHEGTAEGGEEEMEDAPVELSQEPRLEDVVD